MDFAWIDNGVLHCGRGTTRDISAKGMFIYSDSEPPTKADLQVEVSFGDVAEAPKDLRLSFDSLVIRVDSAASCDALSGFALLNRSYKLHNRLAVIDEGDSGLETS